MMTLKPMLAGLLLTTLFAIAARAQQPAPARQLPINGRHTGNDPNRNPAGRYRAADPTTRARKMTDELTRKLGLDAATAQKVYSLVLARDQQIDAIQTGLDDNQTKNTKLNANANAFKSGLQGLLTPAQFQQFQAMKHHNRGNGVPDRPNSNTTTN